MCRQRGVVDVHLDSEEISRSHAAVVHHSNGNIYLIDLNSVRSFCMWQEWLEIRSCQYCEVSKLQACLVSGNLIIASHMAS
jgi:hypothetical protein